MIYYAKLTVQPIQMILYATPRRPHQHHHQNSPIAPPLQYRKSFHSKRLSKYQQRNQVQWRRDKVQELCSKGYSQREVSQTLQVGLATGNRDISYLRDEARQSIFIFRKVQIHNPYIYKMK